jgi:hypothetical protein
LAEPLSDAEASALAPAAWTVAPLLFASGLCALVYQVGWQRELRLIFGASTAASAAVIAVFMGGLGLGGLLLGPRADAHGRPLRFYAVLEAAVAAAAALSPALLAWSRDVYASMGGSVVLGAFGGTSLRLLLAALAHRLYVAGDLAGAAQALGTLPGAPEGLLERAILAEGLADRGDSGAVAHIQELRRTEPVEAEAATARLAWRMGQVDLAVGALVSAFTRYRSDPWPGQVSLTHALALADEVSKARPETVQALFDALGAPFAAAALEEPRKIMRLSVESHGGGGSLDRCRSALDPLEPHVPWRADVLRYRVSCYERTLDPRLGRARADLAEHQRAEARASRTAAPAPTPGPSQ